MDSYAILMYKQTTKRSARIYAHKIISSKLKPSKQASKKKKGKHFSMLLKWHDTVGQHDLF